MIKSRRKIIIKPIKPISPNEVDSKRIIPDEVIQVFNDLIVEKWDGDSAVIKQDEAIERIESSTAVSSHPLMRKELFQKRYLDIETLFIQAGWKIKYDKPAYNESFDAYWVFKKG